MPWFKVDDGLSSKLETTRIPRAHRGAAIGLWTLAGSWSARELTDGHIPTHMIDELAGTPEDARRLVEAGFWRAVDDGFEFVVWDGEQPMRAKVQEQRTKTAAKVNDWRARNRVTSPVTNSERNPETNLGSNPPVTLPPTRPDPSRPREEASPLLREEKPKKPARRLPKDWAPNAEHLTRAKTLGLDVVDAAENFRLHAETHDRMAANWNGAFTTWLKKTKPAESARPVSLAPRVGGPDGMSAAEYRAWQDERAEMIAGRHAG